MHIIIRIFYDKYLTCIGFDIPMIVRTSARISSVYSSLDANSIILSKGDIANVISVPRHSFKRIG